MAIVCEAIGDRAVTTTAKIQLSGDRSGNATSWIAPASCRGILAIQPVLYQITPVANVTAITTLKVESDDLGIQAYEVFANPLQSNVATTDTGAADAITSVRYPAFFPCKGGEQVNFYGINQVTSTTGLGANLWWTDDPRNLTDKPYRALVGGTAGAAGSTTSTGTSAVAVAGANITISGSNLKVIKSVYGLATNTTITAANPITGQFILAAPELAFTIRFNADPAAGSLGTAQVLNHLTKMDNLSIPCRTPSTIATTFNITQAPGTAGKFANGILYQDA